MPRGHVKDRNNFEVRGRGGRQLCIDKNEQRMTLHDSPNIVSVSTTFVPGCSSLYIALPFCNDRKEPFFDQIAYKVTI